MKTASASQINAGEEKWPGSRTESDPSPPQTRVETFALAAWALGVIGLLGCGVFVLDDSRKVLFLNSLAADLLGDGLAIRGKRLVAMDRQSDDQLLTLLRLAANSRQGSSAMASAAIRRPSKLPLVVQSMKIEAAVQSAFNSGTWLLVVSDPELRAGPSPDLVAQLFGLTPAELEVAVGIARGKKLAEIAADQGIKVGTVRAHSKVVFSKTNTRGQAELAALLARLEAHRLSCGS
jgi:DNA-binding NarL/FixJ family response regulator